MRIIQWWKAIDKRQRIRYGTMVLGILALAPPVAFVAQAFGSATLCGNLCPRMAIGPSFLRELTNRTAGVLLLAVGWLGTTFFFGRWMCSHFCPVGALTEFGSKILPRKLKIDYSRLFYGPLFRYGFLGAFILLPVLGYASICCAYCNLSTIPETFGAIFKPSLISMLTSGSRLVSAILYVGVLGILATDGRGHCNLVCPVGALDTISNAIGAKLSFTRRERIRASDCSGCGRCVKGCPTYAITMAEHSARVAQIDYQSCNQCRRCEDSCPKGAITYGTIASTKGES